MFYTKALQYLFTLCLFYGGSEISGTTDEGSFGMYKAREKASRQLLQNYTILPLGDSITTDSGGFRSYRYFLWKALVLRDDIGSLDFIGTLQGSFNGNPEWPPVNGETFDSDHEGHWGWRTDAILGQIDGWLDSYVEIPNVALVHLGTNDCFQGQSIESTLDKIRQLIDKLWFRNPGMYIFVAKVIPASSNQECLDALNLGLGSMVDTLAGPVHIVDMADGQFNVDEDTYDGVHPNDQGAQKMADKWLEAMITNIPAFSSNVSDSPTSAPTGSFDKTPQPTFAPTDMPVLSTVATSPGSSSPTTGAVARTEMPTPSSAAIMAAWSSFYLFFVILFSV